MGDYGASSAVQAAAEAGSTAGEVASTAGSVAGTAADTASTLGQTASTAGEVANAGSQIGQAGGFTLDSAGNASQAMPTMGPTLDAANGVQGTSDIGNLMQQGQYANTAPTGSGYFVGSAGEAPSWGSQAIDNLYQGSQGTFGDFLSNVKDGNYMQAAGYAGSKLGNLAMSGKGGGQAGASPISIQAGQPNPDNSYLQRLRKLSSGRY